MNTNPKLKEKQNNSSKTDTQMRQTKKNKIKNF